MPDDRLDESAIPSAGAVHEAAHVVIGVSQGLKLKSVRLAGRGGGTHWRLRGATVRSIALMAWAPHGFEWTAEAVAGDRVWLERCADETSPEYVESLRPEAIALFHEHLLAITSLAGLLDRRRKLTAREVEKHLRSVSLGGPPR